jgi:hypothetical protein
MLDVVACTCHLSYKGGLNRRLRLAQEKHETLLQIKISKAKRAGGMGQVVEYFSSKSKALS